MRISSTVSDLGRQSTRNSQRLSALLLATVASCAIHSSTNADPLWPLGFPSLGTSTLPAGTYAIDTSATPPTFTGQGTNLAGSVSASGVAVFRFDDLTVKSAAVINAFGGRPVALLASGNLVFSGTLNANGGSPANVVSPGGVGGPGGFSGGVGPRGPGGNLDRSSGTRGEGTGGGWGGFDQSFLCSSNSGSGGGGGFGSPGGQGSGGFSGGSGGPASGVQPNLQLAGGSGGGGGSNIYISGIEFSYGGGGGGGGGAIELGTLGTLSLAGSTINARGGAGLTGVTFDPPDVGFGHGGGGGSGGAVLLHASTLLLGGSINAIGGTGGGSVPCIGFGGTGGGGRIAMQATNNPGTAGIAAGGGTIAFAQIALPTATNLNFGSVALGTTATANMNIQYNGPAGSVSIGQFPDAFGPFTRIGTGTFSVAAGATTTCPYTFSPTAIGPFSQNLTVLTNAGPVNVTISGTCIANTSSPCEPFFGAPTFSAAGTNPAFAAVADVSGDAVPDVLISNGESGNISVLLGNGDGTLQFAVNFGVGYRPSAAAIADFNGDGLLDLVTANLGTPATLLPGNGDGTFDPFVFISGSGGGGGTAITTGDFNGDGFADLALTRNDNVLVILLGNGDGTFAAPTILSAGTYPSAIAARDLNRDGYLDLVVINTAGVSIFRGNGNGTFTALQSYNAGTTPNSVAVEDFNSDGKLDLAVSNQDSANVSIRLGVGDGTFAAAVNYPAAAWPTSIVAIDANGDGHTDLVVANHAPSWATVLRGNGDGTFAAPVSFPEGDRPFGIAAGDLNHDGRPDLVLANYWGNNIAVLLNSSSSLGFSQQPASQSAVPGTSATFQAIATGTGPFTYQWRHNGSPMLGATSSTLTIPNVNAGSAGVYDVQIRGGCTSAGFVTSLPAILTIGSECPADYNNDGVIDFFDYLDFVDAFSIGC